MFPTPARLSLLFLGMLSLTSCSPTDEAPEGPRALRGVLDLTGWSWDGGPVSLDGEWTLDGLPWVVPSSQGFHGNALGSGVYRLRVKLPPGTQPLAMRLPILGTAFRLSVDGTELASEGRVSSRPEGAVPSYRPRVVLVPWAPVVEVQIEVSNWDDQFGGIYYGLSLGPWTQVQAQHDRASLWEALMFGAIFLMGLFHCGSFVFRSQNRAPLWFGLFCLLIAVRSTLYSEVIFLEAFPSASWYLVIKGVYATMALAMAAFAAFVDRLYPTLAWRPATLAAVGGGVAYALVSALAPVAWTTALLPPFQLLMVSFGVYSLVTVGRALVKREPGAALFLVGTALFLASIVLDIVKNYLFWDLPSLVNLGTLAFLMAQALVVARLFATAFASAEQHSAAMDEINTSLERFIPREVLGFLNKKSITEIDLGDFAEMPATVFFLDIRDFTSLSETMSPQQNFKFINSFLKRFGPIIRDHNGFVDKYLGDGMMALFPGSPDDAVAAAVTMRRALQEYNAGRERGGYVAIRFGIGIHTGPLMLGTIGENRRMDSTVISDTVNAASRLEGLTKKYAVDILLSGKTVEALKDPGAFTMEFVAIETVKGKIKPIEVFLVKE